jgi:hypothetical protein
MFQFKITTFNPDKEYSGFHFFILNKGLNSGKPLLNPCPNCFVLNCVSAEVKLDLYWLIYGLWQGKAFRSSLIGSVIIYIRKNELENVIKNGIVKLEQDPIKVKKNISAVAKIEEHRLNILKQIQLMQQLKLSLMFDILK